MDKLLKSKFANKKLTIIHIDQMLIGFAQNKVLTIEKITDIDNKRESNKYAGNKTGKLPNKVPRKNLGKSSGTLQYAASELPIYTFDNDLSVYDQARDNNRFCIALKHSNSNESFAINCDAVEQFNISDDNNLSSIPPLNNNPNSPIIGLLNKETKLVLLASAESMRVYINSLETRHVTTN